MNPQPKPSADCLPGDRMPGERTANARPAASRPVAVPRGRVPVAGPRLLFTWPVEFEVEPWHP